MRLLTLVILATVLIGAAFALFTFVGLREVHIASLVPGDFRFGVFYSSVNDLEELYEGRLRRKDFNPAKVRIANRMNVPGFEGVPYDEPVGYFVTRDKKEYFLAPYTDLGALEDAFDKGKENLNLNSPRRVARNYVSISAAPGKVTPGPDNPLVLEAVKYPVALAGRPDDANAVRLMLRYLLAWDGDPKLPGVPRASDDVVKLPPAVTGLIAEECEGLVLGFSKPKEDGLGGLAHLFAQLSKDGALDRAAALAEKVELSDVLGCFPRDTAVLAGAVLDARGWKRVGVPLPMGDGALAAGVVHKQYHARRFTVLVVARPTDPLVLKGMFENALRQYAGVAFTDVADKETTVKTAKLQVVPEGFEVALRSAKKAPPPVYVSTAVEKGTWFWAIGSQAESVVRHALSCLRGATQLSIYGQQRAPYAGPIKTSSPLKRTRGHVAVAYAEADGMRAFRYPLPWIDIAGIGQPAALTATLDVSRGEARGEIRFLR